MLGFHNKLLIIFFFLFIVDSYTKADEVEFITLDQLPEWIAQNIHFPEDAYEYGFAGRERFVVSLDWSGRAFITSCLNTLHPAFSKEIQDVVRRAPKCRTTGILIEDIYKAVEIDFNKYVPNERRHMIKNVGEYRFPIFSGTRASIPNNSREDFIDWLTERYELPKGLNSYKDTITIVYNVSKNGRIRNTIIKGVRSKPLFEKLDNILKTVPSWNPAQTRTGEKIEVQICDNFIIRTDTAGRKLPSTLLKDMTCENSTVPPQDLDILVLNPEVKVAFNGLQTSIRQLFQDSIRVNREVRYSTTMVIEKNGRVGEFHVEAEDYQINERLKYLISLSQWLPAIQGGVPVRCICSFSGLLLPQQKKRKSIPTRLARYGSFMMSGRHPAFYDPDYEADQQKRWKKLIKSYPHINADIYGYSIFRRMDRATYIEYLITHGERL